MFVMRRMTTPRRELIGRRSSDRADAAAHVRRALDAMRDRGVDLPPVTLRFWDGSAVEAGPDAPALVFRDRVAVAYLLHEPNELGLARAWVAGALEVDGDLEDVLAARRALRGSRLSAGDFARLAAAAVRIGGPRVLAPPPVPETEVRPGGRRHSLARDRHVVRHHYDVSNRFYRLVLGPSLTYSCAYFASPGDTLEAAQERKHELICRKLALAPGERLLDVGCGWGSLLLHAAARHGVRGVGITLSEPQARLARERVEAAGLGDRVEIRVADYREVADGPFDKIASVGMYEHVGRTRLRVYLEVLARLLRPGGLVLNHGIARLAAPPGSPKSFIARYVFPDGELHPVTDVMSAMQAAGLEVRDVESLREHYVLTLRRWVANLEAHAAEAVAEAGAQRERIWRLYMVACAQAFEVGDIGVFQVLAARGGAPHGLPLERAALLGPG
jgi:cyclopropane-fatty-acyl-phospholipid synthase